MKVLFAESLDQRPIGKLNYSEKGISGQFHQLLKLEYEKIINGDHELSKKWLFEF